MSIIKLKGVSKFYRNKTSISSGFTKLNLELNMGEFVVITGESGSGKSTLLNVISGLDSYEEGEMYINGVETSHYTEVDYENYRRKYIGNIFQHFNLVNSYTVYQNIELVLILNGYKKKDCKERINDIIKTVGLTKYRNTKASKLSGGQKQRVAIARALAKDTPIIVADEPTGNLDVTSAKSIMKLLYEISKEKLVVIVTHNYEQVEEYTTRKISMHDGKIIEDKVLTKTPLVDAEPVKYKDISKLNRLGLGIRNTFNIKTKFILLLIVYAFLTFIVASEYTSLKSTGDSLDIFGYNQYFQNTDKNRVILNKKDKTTFTDEDLKNIKNIINIESIEKDDLILDSQISIYDGDLYLSGIVSDKQEITSVDLGELPTNENDIVIKIYERGYYAEYYKDSLIGRKLTMRSDANNYEFENKVNICGIIYMSDEDFVSSNTNYYIDSVIYVKSDKLAELRKGININYSDLTITINNHILSNSSDSQTYFRVQYNTKVPDGEVYSYQELNNYCKNYNCLRDPLNLKVSNLYYEDSVDLKVTKVLNKDNFKSATGLKNIDDYNNTLFISVNDYNRLFTKDSYQTSVFLKDVSKSTDTLKELDNMGYNAFYMGDALYNPDKELAGIFMIIIGVVMIIATVILFFISYFVIKIILKSRNVYFSTIRILGATKKTAKSLLNIELLVDINIAYVLFLALILLVKSNVININYIQDLITYLKVYDYILLYLILCVMSLLISNRYSHKLFTDSVMSTYREEN